MQHIVILSLLFICLHSAKSLPPVCDHSTKWKINGRDVMNESRGYILVTVFMPLQRTNVQTHLLKLQSIAETIRDVRMVVIAPYNENHRSLMRFRNQFPKMHFHIESYNESVSNKLGATANDHFIYDRCGRLSNVIRYPRSDVTRYDDILNALKTTINYSHCGWCIYDTLSTTTTPILAPSQVTAYLHPSAAPTQQYASSSLNNDQMSSLESAPSGEYSQRYPGYTGSRQDRVNIAEYPRDSRETSQQSSKKQSASNQRSRFDNFAQSLNGGRSTVNKQVPNSRQGTWRPSSEFVDRSRQQQAQHPERSESSSDDIRRAYSPYSSSDNNNNRAVMSTSQQRTELNINGNRKEEQESERRKQQRIDDEERKREQQEREERQRLEYERRQREYERRKEQLDEYQRRLTEQQLHQKQSHPQQQQHHHQQEQAPHQKTLDVSQRDNVNDNKWASEQRTPPVYGSDEDEEYVDYSTTDLGLPTKPAPFRAQIPPTPAATVWPTPFTFADSIPCAAFTDDVCYQQMKKNGKENVNKCCNKGVYLTDLCMPGRCSNATINLCCIQKFLQAKYLCCANQNNSHFSSGDGFSRCCYENFVHHGDTCCPLPIAKYHWSSTSELCLPNVRVDLSELRVVAELGDSKIVSIDFGEDRSWDYDCDFSSHTSQFVYVPGDDSADSTADSAEE